MLKSVKRDTLKKRGANGGRWERDREKERSWRERGERGERGFGYISTCLLSAMDCLCIVTTKVSQFTLSRPEAGVCGVGALGESLSHLLLVRGEGSVLFRAIFMGSALLCSSVWSDFLSYPSSLVLTRIPGCFIIGACIWNALRVLWRVRTGRVLAFYESWTQRRSRTLAFA